MLLEVGRDSAGRPMPGEVARVAKRHGVAPGTVHSWICRDGWPSTTAPAPPRIPGLCPHCHHRVAFLPLES